MMDHGRVAGQVGWRRRVQTLASAPAVARPVPTATMPADVGTSANTLTGAGDAESAAS